MLDELPEGTTDITPADSVVPVYLVPMTSEQEAEREIWAAEALELEAAQEARAVAKQSAQEKLANLGLTEEEVQALLGL